MRRWRVRLGAFVLALAVTACGGVTQPSRFYLLATPPELERERSTDTAGRDLSVGVGPVVLPPYLDRPQIVTQASRHELDLAEFDQWAEPLEDNFTRVLAENLSVLLATDRIVVFPWRRSVLVDYQIAVNVIRFDAVHGESMLVARWNVFGTGRPGTPLHGPLELSPAGGGSGLRGHRRVLERHLGRVQPRGGGGGVGAGRVRRDATESSKRSSLAGFELRSHGGTRLEYVLGSENRSRAELV